MTAMEGKILSIELDNQQCLNLTFKQNLWASKHIFIGHEKTKSCMGRYSRENKSFVCLSEPCPHKGYGMNLTSAISPSVNQTPLVRFMWITLTKKIPLHTIFYANRKPSRRYCDKFFAFSTARGRFSRKSLAWMFCCSTYAFYWYTEKLFNTYLNINKLQLCFSLNEYCTF